MSADYDQNQWRRDEFNRKIFVVSLHFWLYK